MAKHERIGPPPERPVVVVDGDATVERHPAYAVMRVSRTHQGPQGATLFGSDFRHREYMRLSIVRAERRRSISNDWVHGREELIEVSLSEAQWVTFISSPNVGEGVPCTLNHVGPERIPEIDGLTDRREQFAGELESRLRVVQDKLEELDADILVSTLSQRMKDKLHGLVQAAQLNLSSNLDYVAEQFDEHVEKTVERAKADIHAHLGAVVQRAGLAALIQRGELPEAALPMLVEGEVQEGEEEP